MVPDVVSSEVIFMHDSTCCICVERGKTIQIHHIDESPSNHEISNLALLCLECHNKTHLSGGFGKKLRSADIVRHRDDWTARVSARRDKMDRLLTEPLLGKGYSAQAFDEYWETPSPDKIQGFLRALPLLRRAAHVAVQPMFDSGISAEMNNGCYEITELLEGMWNKIARFYPPNHFSGMSHSGYVQKYIESRYIWHRQINEPLGSGASGTMVGQIVGWYVFDDVARMIAETVEGLYAGGMLDDFDLVAWRAEWEAAGSSEGEGR